MVAEDKDDFEDLDGCLDEDNDADGVLDVVDKCPRNPGEAQFEGCRPPDRDGDRVADHVDACPDVPAPGRRDGCPATVAVAVTADRIEFGERFMFAVDSAVIEPASFPLLDEIAATLNEHPEVKRVRVEGHTDDTGFREYNVKLSRRRATSVVEALVSRGVARERLSAEGFGAARPLVEGSSPEARRQNRRVELVVVNEP